MQEVAQRGVGEPSARASAALNLQFVVVLAAACLPLRPAIQGLPLSTMAAAFLVLIASFHRRSAGERVPRVACVAFVALVAWVIGTSAWFSTIDVRRAGNLVILLSLAWVLGQGRLHMNSFVVGLGLGWAGGIAHAVLTREEITYDGRLTGFLGDPNGAGFVIVTIGLLLIAYARSSGWRPWVPWVLWLITAAGAGMTLSRTTLFALVAASLWALVAPWLGRWSSIAALLIAWPIYGWLTHSVRDAGIFAERAGSDNLRLRLSYIEQGMVGQSGWHGQGLGSAHATVDGTYLWFHNSYRALWVEGGAVAVALLALGLLALLWSIHEVPAGRRNPWYEAAVLAGLICSLNIGFSLTSVPMSVALGMYLLYWRQSVHQVAEQETAVPLVLGRPPAPPVGGLPSRPV